MGKMVCFMNPRENMFQMHKTMQPVIIGIISYDDQNAAGDQVAPAVPAYREIHFGLIQLYPPVNKKRKKGHNEYGKQRPLYFTEDGLSGGISFLYMQLISFSFSGNIENPVGKPCGQEVVAKEYKG